MSVKQQIHRSLWRLGWTLQRLENANVEYQVIKDVLKASAAAIVLDVGANLGQYGDLILDAGFRGKLVSFEAIPEVHRRLSEHARKRSAGWTVGPCVALGSKRGEAAINLAANSVSSSLLPMLSEHVAAEPASAYAGQAAVRIERLDELAPALIPPAGGIMLKIDTQGYELEVLEGAAGLLPRTVAIQLELSIVPLYAGAPGLVDLISYIESRHFRLFSLIPGFKDKRSGQLLQADGVFVRADR